MEVFIKILTKQPDYPEYVDNHSKMVIDGLLEKEPKRRFSAGMFFQIVCFICCGSMTFFYPANYLKEVIIT